MAAQKGSTRLSDETLKRAAEAYEYCFGDLFALDDISRRLAESPFSALTTVQVVHALTASLREQLSKADRLAHSQGVVDALRKSEQASEASRALEDVMFALSDEDFVVPHRSISTVALSLTQRAARAIELANVSCGGTAETGYLDPEAPDPCRASHARKSAALAKRTPTSEVLQ